MKTRERVQQEETSWDMIKKTIKTRLNEREWASVFVKALQNSTKVYVSSFPTQKMWDTELSSLGIDVVISCVEEGEFNRGSKLKREFYKDNYIEHVIVPLKSDKHGYIGQAAELLEQCVDAVFRAKEAIEEGRALLFHCGSGKGRAPTLLIATLALMPQIFNGEINLYEVQAPDGSKFGPDWRIQPGDDNRERAQKIHQWLSYINGLYTFDPFEKLEDDITAILKRYLEKHPEKSSTYMETPKIGPDFERFEYGNGGDEEDKEVLRASVTR